MADEAYFATLDLARTEAIVTAARAKKCRRCPTIGGLDKRQLCPACNAVRLATMAADPVSLTERPTRPQVTTIASLLGNGGMPLCTSPVLDWCNQSMSARASMGEVFTKLGPIESFLILHPYSVSAWDNYERRYAAIEAYVKAIRSAEDKVAGVYPDLKREPIYIPQKLERATRPEWLEV